MIMLHLGEWVGLKFYHLYFFQFWHPKISVKKKTKKLLLRSIGKQDIFFEHKGLHYIEGF